MHLVFSGDENQLFYAIILKNCNERRLFQNSLAEVAKLFTDFFRDLDVVPSDVIAGLVLLRQSQKENTKRVIEQVRQISADSTII